MWLFQLATRLINIQEVIRNAPRKSKSITESAQAKVTSWRKTGVEYRIFWSLEDIASKQLPFKTAAILDDNRSGQECIEMLPILDANPSSLEVALLDGNFKIKWNLHLLPTFPLLREVIIIYDDINSPYVVEVFNNITGPDVQDYMKALVSVKTLRLSFHDHSGKAIVAHEVPMSSLYRLHVLLLFKKAIKNLYIIPLSTRDFEKACEQYEKENPCLMI